MKPTKRFIYRKVTIVKRPVEGFGLNISKGAWISKDFFNRGLEGFRIIGVNGKRIRNQEQAVKRLAVLCDGVKATLSLMVA